MNFHKKHGEVIGVRVGGNKKLMPLFDWIYEDSTIQFEPKV